MAYGRVQASETGEKAVMVSLLPQIMQDEDDELVTEMIFVVDRSGSMVSLCFGGGSVLGS